MAVQRQRDYRPRQDRSGQAPAEVQCTGCGLSFLSAARSHTNCPGCRRNLRVHREVVRSPAAVRRSVSVAPARQEIPRPRRPLPWPTPQPVALWPLQLAPDPPCSDDDDLTYIRDRGRLVLAEWDDEGNLVAAELLPAAYLAREIPARGWKLRPHGQDICQVVRIWPAVAEYPAASEECRRLAAHGQLCRKCFDTLRTPS